MLETHHIMVIQFRGRANASLISTMTLAGPVLLDLYLREREKQEAVSVNTRLFSTICKPCAIGSESDLSRKPNLFRWIVDLKPGGNKINRDDGKQNAHSGYPGASLEKEGSVIPFISAVGFFR